MKLRLIAKVVDKEKELLIKCLKEQGYEIESIRGRSDGKGTHYYYVTTKEGKRLKCHFALSAGQDTPTKEDLVIEPVQKRNF
jgi:hypothetical protein